MSLKAEFWPNLGQNKLTLTFIPSPDSNFTKTEWNKSFFQSNISQQVILHIGPPFFDRWCVLAMKWSMSLYIYIATHLRKKKHQKKAASLDAGPHVRFLLKSDTSILSRTAHTSGDRAEEVATFTTLHSISGKRSRVSAVLGKETHLLDDNTTPETWAIQNTDKKLRFIEKYFIAGCTKYTKKRGSWQNNLDFFFFFGVCGIKKNDRWSIYNYLQQ